MPNYVSIHIHLRIRTIITFINEFIDEILM